MSSSDSEDSESKSSSEEEEQNEDEEEKLPKWDKIKGVGNLNISNKIIVKALSNNAWGCLAVAYKHTKIFAVKILETTNHGCIGFTKYPHDKKVNRINPSGII